MAFNILAHFFTQTTNLIINLDNDDWIFDDDSRILAHLGFGGCVGVFEKSCSHSKSENETEVSFFNRELYEQFKRNPTVGHLPNVSLTD